LKGYIYLDKGYHKGTSEIIYQEIKNNNGIIISLDEEGGVDYSDGSTLLGRYSKVLFDNADLTFMWGEKQFELVQNNMNKKNKVVVTGHPRFELLKPDYHHFYQDEIRKIKKRYKDFILINTNMGFGNNIRGDEFVTSNYGSRFKNIDQIIAFDKNKLEAYRSLIIELSRQLKKTIVLRHHPEEDHSFYLNTIKHLKNVHIIYEGSVVPWILASDFMIHPDCTTAIESLFLGTKPLSFLPDNYPADLVTHLPLKASECFTSESELISFINTKIDSIKKVDLTKYPFVEDYFSISKPSTELIVDSFCQLRKTSKTNKSHNLTLMNLLYLKYSSAKGKLSERKKSSHLMLNKLEGFETKNINKIHKKITSYNKQMLEIGCKTINRNLFKFGQLR